MERPTVSVIAALLMFSSVTLVSTQQPPFPPTGGTVEVQYANRIFQLGQRPELLEFAHTFRETVCINLTMPVENPETFREGSNYKINCLPWLVNFPGGSITWYRSSINAATGARGPTRQINPESPPASVEVRGPFNSELFVTSTIVSPAQELTTSGIYTCEVCVGRNDTTPEELRDEGQCHNASVVTFNIGSPPIIDDTTPDDITFVSQGGIRNYRVGSSPCLNNPPDITPPAQGEPAPDPEAELRIRCDLANAQLTDTSEFPPVTPGPITRRWYFNGVLIYEAALGTAPVPTPEFLAMFPTLDPSNNLILYGNQGWITIHTDIEGVFVNRTDISFDDVFGNWTCSLSNPLGTDVARFGTILTECGNAQQITCYTEPSVAGEFNCLSSTNSFQAATIEECCVDHNGFFFEGGGDEACQACVVFGFFNGSEITLPEQGEATVLSIGFIKGGNVQTLTAIDRRNVARFGITVTGSASPFDDFTIQPTSFEIQGPDARVPFSLTTFVRIDGLALEPAEDFILTLEGRNNAGRAVLSPTIPGQFVVPTIRVVIEDAGISTQQPPFPPTGGTVEVQLVNRIFQLGQRSELLQFARMFRETVCINLTMPVENPETFREGSNYKINCLPWLVNFPGGSITWYRSVINAATGARGPTRQINPESPPASVEVRGPFNSELFVTSTIVSPAQELTTSGIYTCEVCVGRNDTTPEELRDEGQCHNASVVTFNIGSPPVVNDTTPDDITFVEDFGIRSYRVGSSPCLSNPPDITPPAQGVPSPDPEAELRIRCDLANAQLTDTSEFPPATPGPITRRWYFNGVLIYEAALGTAPVPTSEFLAMFPTLDPANNVVLYFNQGWVSIRTDIEEVFVNRTDISFDAVFGNWTCSLSNSLGTDVARFGTILRQCAAPELDLSFAGDSPRLGIGTITAELFTNRPEVQITCFLRRTNFVQDCSDGSVTFTNVPAGGYFLQVVATDRETGDRAEIRTRVFVPGSDEFCSVYAINGLVSVSGNCASAEFRSTGNPTGYQCRVDRQSYFPCTSPVTITGLDSGRHRLRVRPSGCGRPGSGHKSLSATFNV